MLSQLLFRLYAYFKHRLRSLKSARGYGIHSPFAFYFVTEILNQPQSIYYCYDDIEKVRYNCYKDHSIVTLKNGRNRQLSSLCRRSSTPALDAQLLFKIGVMMKSESILELGTFLGLGTAYLASISSKAKVISIDHDKICSSIANKHLKQLDIDNVQLITDSIDVALPTVLRGMDKVDLVFFDANHTYKATLHYFSLALDYVVDNTVFVFHDIHWSKEMYEAWQKIICEPKIKASFESYNIGIVFFKSDLNKQHYYV